MLRLHPMGVACPELVEGLSTNGGLQNQEVPFVLSVAQRSRRADGTVRTDFKHELITFSAPYQTQRRNKRNRRDRRDDAMNSMDPLDAIDSTDAVNPIDAMT